jgi:hypothetical protein
LARRRSAPACSGRRTSVSRICHVSIFSPTTSRSWDTTCTMSTKPRDGRPVLLLHGEPTWRWWAHWS